MTRGIYLFLFFITYFIIVFVWTSYRVYKQTRINPFVFSSTDTAHDFAGLMFKVISAFIFLIVGVYAFGQNYYAYLLPVWYLQSTLLQTIGLILLHLALLWIVIAQIQMGNSWRIGIDEKNRTQLKTNGLFGLSRNPVFLGIIISMLGLLLVLPNALSLLVLFTGWVVLQIQIRLEEEYLLKVHGIQYEQYIFKVRRWI